MEEVYLKVIPKKIKTESGGDMWTYHWYLYEEEGKIAGEHFYLMSIQQLFILFFSEETKDPLIIETKNKLIEQYGLDNFLDKYKQNQEFFLSMIELLNNIVCEKQNIIDEK